MRYLAIDYGTRRTGLAVCDPLEVVVSPLIVIQGQKKLIDKISEILISERIEAVVIGMPLNMDDTKGAQAGIVAKFAEKLKKQITIPIHFQDERLSSFAAGEKLASVQLKRKTKRKLIDAIAAAEILEAFLQSKESNPE